MRESFAAVLVEERLHVVEDGHVLTSAGIAARIDLALRVVEATAAAAKTRQLSARWCRRLLR